MLNSVALTRETVVFVKKESAFGELAFPAATDALAVLEVPQAGQADEFVDSKEIANSRSRADRAWVGTAAGQTTLKAYARPSGSPGVAPVEDVLLECLFGTRAVDPGVSVSYSPALFLPSCTLAFREGHTVHLVTGCMVNTAKLAMTKKDFLTWEFGLLFQKSVRAGREETAEGSTTTVLNLAAGGAELFDVGSRVEVDGVNNGGQGYEVTAVDLALDAITLGTALGSAPAAGVTVQGYLPARSLSGVRVVGCTGSLTLDGAELTVTGFDGNLSNGLNPDDMEISSAGYIPSIAEGARTMGGAISARFRRQYLAWFGRARRQVRGVLEASAGSGAGSLVTLRLPHSEFNTPSTGGDEFRRTLQAEVAGMASAALEDEGILIYQ